MFLLAFPVSAAEEQKAQKPKAKSVQEVTTKKLLKAKPVEMPQATSKYDQVSATGYHDKEVGEETQEMPNPVDNTSSQIIDPLHDHIRGDRQI